jgi:hypothetical protein
MKILINLISVHDWVLQSIIVLENKYIIAIINSHRWTFDEDVHMTLFKLKYNDQTVAPVVFMR